ncbi:hypothetical protein ACLKA7_011579 [Drosophila subpalustris]
MGQSPPHRLTQTSELGSHEKRTYACTHVSTFSMLEFLKNRFFCFCEVFRSVSSADPVLLTKLIVSRKK